MAKQNEHVSKALSNLELIKPIEDLGSHPDWAVTVKFYAAVHWLRALLAKHGVATGRHDSIHYNEFSTKISQALKQVEGRVADDVDEALEAFEDLRDLSQTARYKCLPVSVFHQRAYEADDNLSCIQRFVESRGITK